MVVSKLFASALAGVVVVGSWGVNWLRADSEGPAAPRLNWELAMNADEMRDAAPAGGDSKNDKKKPNPVSPKQEPAKPGKKPLADSASEALAVGVVGMTALRADATLAASDDWQLAATSEEHATPTSAGGDKTKNKPLPTPPVVQKQEPIKPVKPIKPAIQQQSPRN